MQSVFVPARVRAQRSAAGFTLIELMVAVALGLLVSIGIISLFQGTSYTNRVQEGLARLQENGRYAMGRLNDDIRASAHQLLSVSNNPTATKDTTSGGATNGILSPMIFADVYTPTLVTETSTATAASRVRMIHDAMSKLLIAPATSTAWPGSRPWPLGSTIFMQGYECGLTTCVPALPPMFPTVGTGNGNRVPGTDVLTIRYVNDGGWLLQSGTGTVVCTSNALTSLTLTPPLASSSTPPYLDGEKPLNFQTGDLMMIASTFGTYVAPVTVTGSASSMTLVPTSPITGVSVPCPTGSQSPTATVQSMAEEVRVYNLSADMRTVSYFVQFVQDPNPDAGGRMVPTLMRREDGVASALISGVDRLDFLYAVEDGDGNTSYLTANDIGTRSNSAAATWCPPVPDQYQNVFSPVAVFDPDCLWRAVKNVEVHMLLNSGNEIGGLAQADRTFRYSLQAIGATTVDYTATANSTPATPATALVTGARSGNLMRREFTGVVTVRNYSP